MAEQKRARDAVGRSDAEHLAIVQRKSAARMNAIDNMSPAVRELIHNYGYMVVKSFLDIGITKPAHIRHLVEVVLDE
jgi:hypothetical protein